MPTEDWKYQISLALPEGTPDATLSALYDIVEAALEERDERAAKIAGTIPDTRFDLDHEPALTEQQIRNAIATAIRNEDTNA